VPICSISTPKARLIVPRSDPISFILKVIFRKTEVPPPFFNPFRPFFLNPVPKRAGWLPFPERWAHGNSGQGWSSGSAPVGARKTLRKCSTGFSRPEAGTHLTSN